MDAKSVSPVGEGKVKAFVTTPTGTRMEALVTNNNDGTYKCMYTPFEQGKITHMCTLPCNVKKQYLLTLQVSRYCLLTLQTSVYLL